MAEPKDPATCNVFALLKLFLDERERADWEDRYRAGGLGYGDVKKELLRRFLDYFGPMRTRREELLRRPDVVEEVFQAGVVRAREVALPLVARVRDAVGIPSSGGGVRS